MKVTVKYFGVLTDISQKDEEPFEFSSASVSLEQFRGELQEKYPKLEKFNFTIAVNQTISGNDVRLNHNDIIALLPPFSGG